MTKNLNRTQLAQSLRDKGYDVGSDVNSYIDEQSKSQHREKNRAATAQRPVIITNSQQAKAAVEAAQAKREAIAEREQAIADATPSSPVNHFAATMTPAALAAAGLGKRGSKRVKELVKATDDKLAVEAAALAEKQRIDNDPATITLREDTARLVKLVGFTGDPALIAEVQAAQALVSDDRQVAVDLGREKSAAVQTKLYERWKQTAAAKKVVTDAAFAEQQAAELQLAAVQPPVEPEASTDE